MNEQQSASGAISFVLVRFGKSGSIAILPYFPIIWHIVHVRNGKKRSECDAKCAYYAEH